jgi:hypothetical protein
MTAPALAFRSLHTAFLVPRDAPLASTASSSFLGACLVESCTAACPWQCLQLRSRLPTSSSGPFRFSACSTAVTSTRIEPCFWGACHSRAVSYRALMVMILSCSGHCAAGPAASSLALLLCSHLPCTHRQAHPGAGCCCHHCSLHHLIHPSLHRVLRIPCHWLLLACLFSSSSSISTWRCCCPSPARLHSMLHAPFAELSFCVFSILHSACSENDCLTGKRNGCLSDCLSVCLSDGLPTVGRRGSRSELVTHERHWTRVER